MLAKKKITKSKWLSKDRERYLIMLIQNTGDQEAIREIVEAHLPLIKSLAKKRCFKTRDNEGYETERYQDLIACGKMGILKSFKKFKPSYGYRFNTFARWGINGEMSKYVMENDLGGMKFTAGEKAVFSNLMRVKSECGVYSEDIPEGRLQDIVDAINRDKAVRVTPDQVSRVNAMLCTPDVKLNQSYQDSEGYETAFELPDEQAEAPDGAVLDSQKLDLLLGHKNKLTERQRAIIDGRYRVGDPITYEVLGVELGISGTRVQQIEKQALANLKNSLKKTYQSFRGAVVE